MGIADLIPYGRENAISREELLRHYEGTDRGMRRELQEARKTEVIVNLSDGSGYFRPADKYELQAFIAQETARARSIEKTVRVAKKKLAEIDGQLAFDV